VVFIWFIIIDGVQKPFKRGVTQQARRIGKLKDTIMRMKRFTVNIAFALICSVLLSSCLMTKTSVGAYKEATGQNYTYDKGKQVWLFWGLLPMGRTDVSTPTTGDCEVITKFRITDVLISGLTLGIVTSYSIKVKAKKAD